MPSADDLAERQAINKIGSNDVFVRAAKLSDATALIKLNEEFRENMLRWQQEDDDAEYPALDFDDVEFILNEEDEQNLIVLCEKPAGGRRQARIIGYSYAYDEPWAASDDDNQGKGKGKGKGKGRAGEAKQSGENNSLYIAEMFVAKSERGRGLGDVLLFETLNRRCKTLPRSHLYVSSRNTPAVAIYHKFGFKQSNKPSGDISHDLVLEMPNTKKCVTEAAKRLKDKFNYVPDYKQKCEMRTFSPCDPSQPRRPREPSPPPLPKREPCSGKSTRTQRSKRKSDDVAGRAVRRCLQPGNSPVFTITGVVHKEKLRKMEVAIESLGGDVLVHEGFSDACTHVISPKPLLTEKFLCGMAAGKILVHDSYLWESERAGHLLDAAPYEWASISRPSSVSKVKAEMDSVSRELAKAVYKRRAAQQQNEQIEGMGGVAAEPPFKGMVVMLLVSDDKRRQLHNLLLAGGADVCPDLADVCSGAKTLNMKATTHAFVSPSLLDSGSDAQAPQEWAGGEKMMRQARRLVRDLADHGVRCLREEFVVDMLIEGPSLSRRPYQVILPDEEEDEEQD